MSLPSLGAWIETDVLAEALYPSLGRSLHWERGLKLDARIAERLIHSVAPFIGSVD